MTPEERAERWLRTCSTYELYIEERRPSLAAEIRSAVEEERERCESVLRRYGWAFTEFCVVDDDGNSGINLDAFARQVDEVARAIREAPDGD